MPTLTRSSPGGVARDGGSAFDRRRDAVEARAWTTIRSDADGVHPLDAGWHVEWDPPTLAMKLSPAPRRSNARLLVRLDDVLGDRRDRLTDRSLERRPAQAGAPAPRHIRDHNFG